MSRVPCTRAPPIRSAGTVGLEKPSPRTIARCRTKTRSMRRNAMRLWRSISSAASDGWEAGTPKRVALMTRAILAGQPGRAAE